MFMGIAEAEKRKYLFMFLVFVPASLVLSFIIVLAIGTFLGYEMSLKRAALIFSVMAIIGYPAAVLGIAARIIQKDKLKES